MALLSTKNQTSHRSSKLEPRILARHDRTSVTCYIDFGPVAENEAGVKFKPDEISYNFHGTSSPKSVLVSGFIEKKNGTLGRRIVSQRFWLAPAGTPGYPSAPDWLRALIPE